MKCYQRHSALGKGDRKSSELKWLERFQPREENSHGDTGDLKTDKDVWHAGGGRATESLEMFIIRKHSFAKKDFFFFLECTSFDETLILKNFSGPGYFEGREGRNTIAHI